MRDCFIICPLDQSGSLIRKRSDTILRHVLTPILAEKNYNPIRADQIPKSGLITSQIINLIIDSPLVIADLSGGNPNVFYELAIRHATRKPYIQIIEEGEKIPFDIGGIRTVYIDHTNLDNVEEAKAEIIKQIDEIEKGHLPDSPISIATSVKLIQENEDLAAAIAEKIDVWGDPSGGYYDYNEVFDSEIHQKIDDLTTYGIYKIADLDKKIDTVIDLLNSKSSKA